MVIAHDMALPSNSISFQYPAPNSAGHIPSDPSRPAGQTLALVGPPWARPLIKLPCLLSDPKRQNHHLCATCSRLGSTRLARPGRGAARNSSSERRMARDRPDPGPGLSSFHDPGADSGCRSTSEQAHRADRQHAQARRLGTRRPSLSAVQSVTEDIVGLRGAARIPVSRRLGRTPSAVSS